MQLWEVIYKKIHLLCWTAFYLFNAIVGKMLLLTKLLIFASAAMVPLF